MAVYRTLEDIKNDVRSRVGHRAPFILADTEEVEQVLASLTNVEADSWAEAWSRPGLRWEKAAREKEESGELQQAKQAYLKAYTYYGIARHPFPSSPGKKEAYRKTIEMYLAAARYLDPPLERVRVPFDGKEIVGYLRLPSKKPAPLIIHWGGIDNWKEERHSFAEAFLREGWGCFVMDSPGTGECPLLASPEAHAVYSAALDYLLVRKEIDPRRIAVVGASFGGYWSTKVAHVEHARLCAAVNWGGGIHYFFQPEWQEKSKDAPSYLFDLIEARANLFGKKNFQELVEVMPALSLKTQGWLDKPCAPLLLINGKEDRQVPIEDFYLLLETGEPKSARFFPGGHMGSSPEIFPTIIKWLHRQMG
ncbi:MAG: alpha/beta fold hydrolase [Deltaproteobacteria bacterium]|nr:alpha/beta fold hydrolase [Deltaproteobacteria bacterium]